MSDKNVSEMNVEAAKNCALAIASLSVFLDIFLNRKINKHGDTLNDFVRAIPDAKKIEKLKKLE